MAIKMLIFDFRDSEKNFFEQNKFEHFDIKFYPFSLNENTVEELPREELENTFVISVFVHSEVNEYVINKFKNLRIISTRSTGFDHISKKTVQEKNIAVINVDSYGSKSVAQFTIGLMIALVRKLVPASQYLKRNKGFCTDFLGKDLSNLTLGVVGTGAIGSSVATVAKAFGMNILAYDLKVRQELIESIEMQYVNLEELLRNSDIVSLHLPYTGKNYHMFSTKQFDMMKQGAYFINTSRGEVVDTLAIYDALVSGKFAGAALDVVGCEDISFKCDRFANDLPGVTLNCVKELDTVKKLAELDNAIITPHVAYETQDAIDYILQQTFKSIREYIKGSNEHRVY